MIIVIRLKFNDIIIDIIRFCALSLTLLAICTDDQGNKYTHYTSTYLINTYELRLIIKHRVLLYSHIFIPFNISAVTAAVMAAVAVAISNGSNRNFRIAMHNFC